MFLVFLNHFDVLMLKIIFKKLKNIINIYFNTKNYLKNNHNYKINRAREALARAFVREEDKSKDRDFVIILK